MITSIALNSRIEDRLTFTCYPGSPSIENSTAAGIIYFINEKVTCGIPPDDPNLADLVRIVQTHTHSIACRKHEKSCRFNFPRPPLKATTVFTLPETVPAKHAQEAYSAVLSAVQKKLEAPDGDFNSVEELLEAAEVSEKSYFDALRWIKTKSRQPADLPKRSPAEKKVNNYNSVTMKAWEANLDV